MTRVAGCQALPVLTARQPGRRRVRCSGHPVSAALRVAPEEDDNYTPTVDIKLAAVQQASV